MSTAAGCDVSCGVGAVVAQALGFTPLELEDPRDVGIEAPEVAR